MTATSSTCSTTSSFSSPSSSRTTWAAVPSTREAWTRKEAYPSPSTWRYFPEIPTCSTRHGWRNGLPAWKGSARPSSVARGSHASSWKLSWRTGQATMTSSPVSGKTRQPSRAVCSTTRRATGSIPCGLTVWQAMIRK